MKMRTVWYWKRIMALLCVVLVGSLLLHAMLTWAGVEGLAKHLAGFFWGVIATHLFMAKCDLWRFEMEDAA